MIQYNTYNLLFSDVDEVVFRFLPSAAKVTALHDVGPGSALSEEFRSAKAVQISSPLIRMSKRATS